MCVCDIQVDDGFWEGELDGRIGVFPSLVVELLTEEGEEDEEDLVGPALVICNIQLIMLQRVTYICTYKIILYIRIFETDPKLVNQNSKQKHKSEIFYIWYYLKKKHINALSALL